jgi:6-phosphogluconolactonase
VSKRNLIICRSSVDLAQKAAAQFASLAAEAIARSGRFTVALSGGSTPRALYSLLSSPEWNRRIDWSHSHLFWGDERCVPPDHDQSNYRMVHEALLSKIQMPPENIHRMAGEKEPRQAASEYEEQLRKFFQLSQGKLPRFDLILLGLGEEGHTASLFPGAAALEEKEQLVTTAYVETIKAHRLTLTLPVINAASQVTFLVAGENKRMIVKQLLAAGTDSSNLPAARVSPTDGKLTWLVAEDAADEISAN